eukprot:6201410-Pleurochrysis_carterae.AAC.6
MLARNLQGREAEGRVLGSRRRARLEQQFDDLCLIMMRCHVKGRPAVLDRLELAGDSGCVQRPAVALSLGLDVGAERHEQVDRCGGARLRCDVHRRATVRRRLLDVRASVD